MYWNRFADIEVLPDGDKDYLSVIQHLNVQYRLGLAEELAQPSGQSKDEQSKNPVRHIKKKPLGFYKNASEPPLLFEVDLDLGAIDERYGDKSLTNYEWTRVYLVRVCADKADKKPEQSTDEYEWYLLDGESGVLHALNAKFGGININDSSYASEYLDFFCSFLSAKEGVFALIQQEADLNQLEDQGERFEAELDERRRYAVFDEKKKYINKMSWGKVDEKLKQKLEELKERNGQQRDSSGQGASAGPGDSAATDSRTENKKVLYGLVLYGKEVRESSFELTESGMVTMRGDQECLRDLPVRRHTTWRHKRSGLIRFTKSASRKRIPAAEFKNLVVRAVGVASFYFVLIEENVKFDPTDKVSALECLDVHFWGEVTFDHCDVTAVFRFEDCKFLGGFHAPGTTFNSQVSFKKSEIFFLSETWLAQLSMKRKRGEGDYPVALTLDYAKVKGSLSLEWLTSHGSVSGRHLTVKSDANFSGLQVLPLVGRSSEAWTDKSKPEPKPYKAARGNGPVLLDLQRSSFAGSLNLGISMEKDVGLKQGTLLRRTRVTVCGDCRFDTMSIGKSLIIEGLAVVRPRTEEVDLKDFRFGDCDRTLSMSNVTVNGNIQSWEYDSWDLSGQTIPPPLVVDGTIDLRWSKIGGYVDLRMSQVRKDLDCIGMRAAWLTLEPFRPDDVASNDDQRRKADEFDWIQYSVLDPSSPSPPVGNAPSEWMKAFAWRMSAIGGDLKLDNATIPGGVTLTGTTIKGTVDVRLGAQLGQIKAMPALGICTENTGAIPSRKVVKQNAFLGGLSIRDSTISGPVYLWGAQIGCADDKSQKAPKSQNASPKPVIDIATSNLKGGLYLHVRSRWEGQETVRESLDEGCNWLDKSETKKAVETKWSDHGGNEWKDDLDLEDGQYNYFWKTISDVFHTTVNGNVDVLASDIGADVDLSNTRVCGRVRLNDSHVKCDVRAVACLQEFGHKFTAVPSVEQKEALCAELQTQCFHFEFQSLRCDGDLMLAGLAVAGDIDGRNAGVRGHVEFVCDERVKALPKPGSGQRNASGRAFIGGDLDLCGCEIGLLRIDGQSVQTTAKKINLARVTVSTLEIVESLPKKINLQSIRVGTWRVEDPKALLTKADPYDSWAYKSVENWLASTGQDDKADDMHMERNRKELDLEEGKYSQTDKTVGWISAIIMGFAAVAVPIWLWSACILCLVGIIILYRYWDQTVAHLDRPLSWIRLKVWNRFILEKIMGFGTRLGPAFCIWLVLAISLGLVLSHPRNVQPTFAAVNAGLPKHDLKIQEIRQIRKDLQKLTPEAQEWGFWNHALWLALDITVPLIPFNLHDEWEPRETTEGTAFPCCSQSEMLIAPKTLANIFTPLSWII